MTLWSKHTCCLCTHMVGQPFVGPKPISLLQHNICIVSEIRSAQLAISIAQQQRKICAKLPALHMSPDACRLDTACCNSLECTFLPVPSSPAL
jgi:hypothetical protein